MYKAFTTSFRCCLCHQTACCKATGPDEVPAELFKAGDTALDSRPVSHRISRWPKKISGLAAINFAKPPAVGRKKIRLSRRFCRRLSCDHNDLHGVKIRDYTAVHSIENYNENYYVQCCVLFDILDLRLVAVMVIS